MKELMQQFLSEANDLLQQVDTGLLQLERDPSDKAVLDEVFRAAHTIKGSSGLFDLPQLTRLTHAAEDLLDAVRADRLSLTVEMADDLLATFDLVRRWTDVLERTNALPVDATADGAALISRLREPLGHETTTVPSPRAGTESAGESAAAPPAPGWLLDGLGSDRVEQIRSWLEHAHTRARVLRFIPTERCFFGGEDPLHLIAQIPAIEDLSIVPREPWSPMVDFDEYRCLLTFTVVTRASIAELEHLCRYVPDEVSYAEVDAAGLSRLLDPTHDAAADTVLGEANSSAMGVLVSSGSVPSPWLTAAVQVLSAQLRLLRAPLPIGQERSRISSAGTVARAAFAALGRSSDYLDTLSAVLVKAVEEGAPELFAAEMEGELDTLLASTVPPLSLDDTTAQANQRGSAGDQRGDRGDRRRSADRRVGAGDRRGDPESDSPGSRLAPRVLKVDQATVDRLLDLVGELVVAKNGLPFLAASAETQWNARALGRQIKDQYGIVTRITEELQSAVMDVRMLPMSVAYARFPRMIRDLARSLGKEVVLQQEGQDTAVDKDIIEMLGDPMVHLIRNSLDHGIERPDERIAAGKPAQATVLLRAVQEPDAVVIDIIDDGRGIDPEKVKSKAYARGLITEDELETVTDQEAVNMVFLPGFSTAEQISDVSGRGVGMDAVRASVEAAGGSVRLTSTPGRGSQVRLRVPLSMAVSRVMIVTVEGQRFGVPVDLVIETVRLPRERVSQVGQQDVIVLRESVVPLVDLAQALQMSDGASDEQVVSVLVTRVHGHDVGLVVDALHEGTEVIVKPMEGIVAGTSQFCGTALLGDGSVLLVLDVKEVLFRALEPV